LASPSQPVTVPVEPFRGWGADCNLGAQVHMGASYQKLSSSQSVSLISTRVERVTVALERIMNAVLEKRCAEEEDLALP